MTALALLVALAIDRFLGEWPARVHPVVWIGDSVRAARNLGPATEPPGRPVTAFLWGLGMAIGLPLIWATIAWGCTRIPYVGWALGVYWLKSAFALRVLGEAGAGVAAPLRAGDLETARRGLRSLCSRDATHLSEGQVAAGAVESLAENLSDSFVAPLFWFVVAGVPGAVAYRVVNTLDAMIGYRGRYEWLGKASARLDDLANLVPARLTALLLLGAAALLRSDVRGGLTMLRRDRAATDSPNAGWPMATMAGLLSVSLEKPGHYRLGDGPAPAAADIDRAWRICVWAAGIAGVLALLAVAVTPP